MQIKLALLFCLALIWSSEAFKLLVVFMMPTRSHANLGDGVVRHLLNAGHEVTYLTPYHYKNAPPNLRQIDISKNIGHLPSDSLNLGAIMQNGSTSPDNVLIKKVLTGLAVKTIENVNVQKLLHDPKEHFDAVIIEWMFTELSSGLATVFGAPLIWVSPVDTGPETIGLIDAMPNPAFVPDMLRGELPPLSFWQRVSGLWGRVKLWYLNFMYFHDQESKEYERLLAPLVRKRGRHPPTYNEVRYNASLVLGNSHVSTGRPLNLPQAYKLIGGYHIDENVKPLPEDIKKIMETAKNGVIYFSMGSNLKSKEWPEEIKYGLLKMFGELKQTVIWKFEESLPNPPGNVHILQWAPQPSILSHPNCVVFISHGGLLSTTETIHYGVPIIGIPVFGDQFVNVNMAVNKGFAVKVDLTFDLVRDLKVAIEEITRSSRYRDRVKELSFIYHHRPAKPGAELVHWVEHVVETRGASHLRSPGLSTPLYQRLYLDLIASITLATVVLLVIFQRVCASVFPKKTVDKSKKNK